MGQGLGFRIWASNLDVISTLLELLSNSQRVVPGSKPNL